MSTPTPMPSIASSTHPSLGRFTTPQNQPSRINWSDNARAAQFEHWLGALAPTHKLNPQTLSAASADASFRRYLRIDNDQGASFIIMDAPPEMENCAAFVKVAHLMQLAGVRVPRILAWDETHGFMLLEDLGNTTLMRLLQSPELVDTTTKATPTRAQLPWFLDAVDILIRWQQASQPNTLPAYDQALLMRELQLFPDWYIGQHKQFSLSPLAQDSLMTVFDQIVQRNLKAPCVYVHRDFMPRNLMVTLEQGKPELSVLDFQDAVYGPITYDIASLMKDAFISWDEDFVLDVTIRYWEKARKAGLLDFDGWSEDFGRFYAAVEWMGLQRHLKVAGIFARLTLRDGKPQYLADTPRFIHYIRSTALRYSQLTPLLRLIDEIEGWQAASGFAFGRT